MARKQGPISDDPFYRRGAAARKTLVDDALPLELDLADGDEEDDPQQFRRATKRVPVRKGALPRKVASRLRVVLVAAFAVLAVGMAFTLLRAFVLHSPRFVVRSANDVELAGEASNSRPQVMKIMSGAVGRNIFALSLSGYRRQLETIPWIESAAVMRLLPNRLRVAVTERTPVAFVDFGQSIELIDGSGVVMELPDDARQSYSFPVIHGMSQRDPLSMRAAQMLIYLRLIRELDGGAAHQQYSHKVDEVDLSDPADVKIVARGGLGPVLLHLGKEDFLPRFQVFLANVQKWEQAQGKLDAVDLRYGREVILNPDGVRAAAKSAAPPPAPAAAKIAAPPAKAARSVASKAAPAAARAKPDAATPAPAATPAKSPVPAKAAVPAKVAAPAHAPRARAAHRHRAAKRRARRGRHHRAAKRR